MIKISNWFESLQTCNSLDEIKFKWDELLDECRLSRDYGSDRLSDAVFSFLARSNLSAQLKLGTILAFVSGHDFNPRLALGFLDDKIGDQWVEPELSSPMMDGYCLNIGSNDPWLLGYLHGRLTEVRMSMRESRGDHSKWIETFWNEFLIMSCRWADIDGIDLAIKNGA